MVVLIIDSEVQVTYCLYNSMMHMAVPMQERPEGRSKSYRLTFVTSWEENGCTYSTYSDSRCSLMRVSAPNYAPSTVFMHAYTVKWIRTNLP